MVLDTRLWHRTPEQNRAILMVDNTDRSIAGDRLLDVEVLKHKSGGDRN